ncbi:MAG: hypothetical protein WD940_02205 [Patescibacteria group bacterium]
MAAKLSIAAMRKKLEELFTLTCNLALEKNGARAAAAVFKYLKDQEPVPDWG